MTGIVKLNVGGQLFEVSKDTLLKQGDTYFCSLMSGNFDRKEGDVVFIDRNPEYFKVILEFMRSGLVSIPDHLTIEAVTEEAEFFHIAQHMFKNSPAEVYVFDKVEAYELGEPEIKTIPVFPDSNVSVYITWICDKKCRNYVAIYEGDKKVVVCYPHNLIIGAIKRMCICELYPRKELVISIGKKRFTYGAKCNMDKLCDGNHNIELVHHVEINQSSLRPKKKRKMEN